MLARISLFLSLLFPGISAVAQDPAAVPADRINLVFWNLEWFPGNRPGATRADQTRQISQVLPAVEQLKPDVLGMMEVRDFAAAELAVSKLSGIHVNVCSAFTGDQSSGVTRQQIALASRLPSMGAWWEPWQHGGEITPPRGFSFAAYMPRPGNVLLVYAVHLKNDPGPVRENIVAREESVRQLLAHQQAMEAAYKPIGAVTVVVGGDFSTSAEDSRFRHEVTLRKMIAGGYQWVWSGVPFANRVTVASKGGPHPAACFDHIFLRGGTLESARLGEMPAGASDHLPVVATVVLPPAENVPPASSIAPVPVLADPSPEPQPSPSPATAPNVEAAPPESESSPAPQDTPSENQPASSPATVSPAESVPTPDPVSSEPVTTTPADQQ